MLEILLFMDVVLSNRFLEINDVELCRVADESRRSASDLEDHCIGSRLHASLRTAYLLHAKVLILINRLAFALKRSSPPSSSADWDILQQREKPTSDAKLVEVNQEKLDIAQRKELVEIEACSSSNQRDKALFGVLSNEFEVREVSFSSRLYTCANGHISLFESDRQVEESLKCIECDVPIGQHQANVLDSASEVFPAG
jgi:hypothetical protein